MGFIFINILKEGSLYILKFQMIIFLLKMSDTHIYCLIIIIKIFPNEKNSKILQTWKKNLKQIVTDIIWGINLFNLILIWEYETDCFKFFYIFSPNKSKKFLSSKKRENFFYLTFFYKKITHFISSKDIVEKKHF